MTEHPHTYAAVEVDPRPRRLLERYVSLVGGTIHSATAHTAEVALPTTEKRFFGKNLRFNVAFTPSAYEEDPQAEILVNGSDLLRRLVEGIQHRGALNSFGEVPATLAPTDATSALPISLESASIAGVTTARTLRPVGRLLARISINAGPMLLEKLVETAVVDLQTGRELELDPTHLSTARASPSTQSPAPTLLLDVGRTLDLLLDDLAKSAALDINRVQSEAEVTLRSELGRLSAYYDRMIAEIDGGPGDVDAKDHKAAIRADRDRRRKEEEYRFAVRVDVHPVQITEWRIPSEEVTWQLQSLSGQTSSLTTSRLLVGDGHWRLSCPTCGSAPGSVRVCKHGHVSCDQCSTLCTVCREACCKEHGGQTCSIGHHAICDTHASTCRSCESAYCEEHSARCELNDHAVCANCIIACGRCQTAMCKGHALQSSAYAPLGQRWLCKECTVYCEGGQNEPVGLDEAVRCATCHNHICQIHQAICAVDGAVHCSKHLRKSDHTGRLLCTTHRASCADEPHSVLGIDEVNGCKSCGRSVCAQHSGVCEVDGFSHCCSHLLRTNSKPYAMLCDIHRTTCQIDGAVYRLGETRNCPVCARLTCQGHEVQCKNCARAVCVKDVEKGVCKTCSRLVLTDDPSDSLIAAGIQANEGEPPRRGSWRTSQDSQHTVVEIDQGWSRRLVLTVVHGESAPSTVMRHSLLGSKRIQ